MGRPGSRPAPATRRLASWRREAARRGCRQRAAAAGQARHGPARRQSPHQIPDLPRGTRRYRRYGRRQAGVQAEALEDRTARVTARSACLTLDVAAVAATARRTDRGVAYGHPFLVALA